MSALTTPSGEAAQAIAATPHERAAPRRASVGERLASAAVAALALTMLIVGATITPSEAGHGSHTQLGLPPCGWAMAFDAPCVTCGMTTAVAHAVHGNILASLVTQPFGLVVALGAAATFWIALHTALTGSLLAEAALRLLRPRVLWGLAALAAAAWAYKWITWPSAA